DHLDLGRERPAVGDLVHDHPDRARDRRGALALGAVGQHFCKALVQARDRIAEMVDGEVIGACQPATRVDIYDEEIFGLGWTYFGPAPVEPGREDRSLTEPDGIA